jgi:guanosine-3',5'-bis(diphosphate) 3'-pyrophosphohydrolase
MNSYELVMVQKAFNYAREKHHGQERKYMPGVPYIIHPVAVAARVLCLDCCDVDMLCAAYLHDVVEDCNVTVGDLVYEGFNIITIDYVLWLTNESKKPEHSHKKRAERKQIDYEHISRAPKKARLIKYCDRICNLRDMNNAPLDFFALYIQESEDLVRNYLFGLDYTLDSEYNAIIDGLYYE